MTETSEPRGSHSTYDFGINLKCTPGRSRILSPMSPSLQREYPAIAWTVRWVLSVRRRAKDKSARVESRCEVTVDMSTGKTFVLYRRQMLKLLRTPKPTFDQLAIELPCLMGFRAGEVGTWRAEYIDYALEDTLVLDAKKHRLYQVPLNTIVARHTETILNGRSRVPQPGHPAEDPETQPLRDDHAIREEPGFLRGHETRLRPVPACTHAGGSRAKCLNRVRLRAARRTAKP